MALDTQSKRLSAISISAPWRVSLPIPDGTVSQGDRQHFMFLAADPLIGGGGLIDTGDPVSLRGLVGLKPYLEGLTGLK